MKISALTAGIIIALLAVVAQGFFGVWPPAAYGVCMTCHARDLVNSLSNWMLGTSLPVAPVSRNFPLLTTTGVFLGALAASTFHGEFSWRLLDRPLKTFFLGIIVMIFSLLALGCSIRLALRAAHGDILGLAGLAAVVVGISLGTGLLVVVARR